METFVSVIIPTYNRCAELAKTLDALAGQTLSSSEFEVVVVDDGSTDGTPQVATAPRLFYLNYVRQQNQGGVAARNQGAVASRSKLLVFIDDDITFEPGYLEAILEAHRRRQKLVCMGVFLPYLSGQRSTFATVYAQMVLARTNDQVDQLVSFTECTSNNMAIERQDFFDIGMWCDVLGGGPGIWGDVEFGYRAWKRGYKFLKVANAKLYHRDYTIADLQSACKRNHYVSHTVHALFRQHPEIVQYLAMFRDKHPISLFSDSPRLIARKVFRMVTSSPLILWTMEKLAQSLEIKAPESLLLAYLYRWIISVYIYRGYRQGLHQMNKATG